MNDSPIGVFCEDSLIFVQAATANTLSVPEEKQDNAVPSQAVPFPAPAANKRSRFSYSKKLLKAPYTFWLDHEKLDELKSLFPDCDCRPFYLDGRIMECPKKSNNNNFLISWDLQSNTNIADGWVCNLFPSLLIMKENLQKFINHHKNAKPAPTTPTSPQNVSTNELINNQPNTRDGLSNSSDSHNEVEAELQQSCNSKAYANENKKEAESETEDKDIYS